MQEKYLAEIAERFAVPILHIPLQPQEIKGLPMVEALGEQILAAFTDVNGGLSVND